MQLVLDSLPLSSQPDSQPPTSSTMDRRHYLGRHGHRAEPSPRAQARHDRAAMPSVLATFKINYLGPAYNLPQPYLDKETLQTFGITIAGLSLTSGKVTDGRAAVLEPIPHEQMEKWITQTGTKTVDSDLANFVHNPDFRLNHNHKEADCLFHTLQFYLSDNLLGMLHPNILDHFTRWEMFPNRNTFLQGVEHSDWYVHGIILRYCKEKEPPALDPRFPHNASFVSDRNPLKDGILSKSELVAILGLAFVFANGALERDDLPFIIPVTIVSASWRSCRVVQGVVDLTVKPKPSIDIRMSRIVDLEKGVKTADAWPDLVKLLSIIVAKPIPVS